MKNINFINVFISKHLGGDHFEFKAIVSFKNGNTEGSQKFEENNFNDLLEKIKIFCETLNK